MNMLHESRLDNVVDCGEIGIGETVDVRTKMGSLIGGGDVIGQNPFGLIVRDNNGSDVFFSSKFHLFSVVENDVDVRVANVITDMSPDDRVELKLRTMSERGDAGGDAGKGSAKPIEKADGKDGKDGDSGDADDAQGGEGGPVASPDTAVDTDALPDDIKKAIIRYDQMDASQLQSVLSEISDAAMKSLKRAGVRETEIFGVVQKIQDASYGVLTGKTAKSTRGSKK